MTKYGGPGRMKQTCEKVASLFPLENQLVPRENLIAQISAIDARTNQILILKNLYSKIIFTYTNLLIQFLIYNQVLLIKYWFGLNLL
jgi:hypothetical protein